MHVSGGWLGSLDLMSLITQLAEACCHAVEQDSEGVTEVYKASGDLTPE